MYYIVITKKQRNVCYNFFESLYSFAHFKCKGYILYSKLLLQWAVEKKKFFLSAKLKKIISRNFQVSHWKKNIRVDYFRCKKAKKCFVEKKILTVNLPWNDPYTLYIGNNITKFDHLSLNISQNNRYYPEKKMLLNQKHFFPKVCIPWIQINML